MDSDHLGALINVAGTDKDGDWSVLKDERTLTLHAADNGVALNVGKIRKVRVEGELLFAENLLGDVFVLKLESVFAGSVDPASKESRKAGFRGVRFSWRKLGKSQTRRFGPCPHPKGALSGTHV